MVVRQFHGFVYAGACTAWHSCTAQCSLIGQYIYFNSRITP